MGPQLQLPEVDRRGDARLEVLAVQNNYLV